MESPSINTPLLTKVSNSSWGVGVLVSLGLTQAIIGISAGIFDSGVFIRECHEFGDRGGQALFGLAITSVFTCSIQSVYLCWTECTEPNETRRIKPWGTLSALFTITTIAALSLGCENSEDT